MAFFGDIGVEGRVSGFRGPAVFAVVRGPRWAVPVLGILATTTGRLAALTRADFRARATVVGQLPRAGSAVQLTGSRVPLKPPGS
jgi:hypothetical protein